MKQYSFAGLYEKLNLSEGEVEFYDKCNWFITHLFRRHMLDDRNKEMPRNFFINVSSDILIKYLDSRDYRKIINRLLSASFIEENGRYSVGVYSKSYAFTLDALQRERIEVEIFSSKFLDRLIKIREKEKEKTLQIPLFRRIINQTAQLKIVEERDYYKSLLFKATDEERDNDIDPDERLKENKLQYYRYESFYNEFKRLSDDSSIESLIKSQIYQSPSIAASGRIYHTLASTPRYIRHSMRHIDGENLWEVDMSAAQPTLLILAWLSLKEKGSTETDLLMDLVLKGGVYKYVENNSEYFRLLDYQKLKKEILQALYEEYTSTQRNLALSALFPGFMGWINKIKKKEGYKTVSHIGQSREADIFVEVYKELPGEMFGLIIHDSILCLEKDAEFIKDSLIQQTKKLFPLLKGQGLTRLFKVGIVSIKDEELMWAKNLRLLQAYVDRKNQS